MNAVEIGILDGIQDIFRNDVLDVVMKFISRIGDLGAVWIALAVVLLIIPRTRRSGVALALSLIAELLLCYVIVKPIAARTRPYDINTDIVLLTEKLNDYSFPSGHTAAAFAAVTALFKCRNRIWIPALVLGIFMGLSRLYLYMHYPSDVIAGVLFGIASGMLGFTVMRFIENNRKRVFSGI